MNIFKYICRPFYNEKYRNDGWHIRILFIRFRLTNFLNYLRPIFILLDYILPKRPYALAFYTRPDFSDNPRIFADYLHKNHPQYKIYWFYKKAVPTPEELAQAPGKKFYRFCISGVIRMLRCKYIVASHATPDFLTTRHVFLDLWHGMPIKTLGFTEPELRKDGVALYKRMAAHSHMFVTSDLFKIIMGVCFGVPPTRIHITGQPRTDVAFGARSNVYAKYSKVICYTPTFKEKEMWGRRNISTPFSNIFYLNDYDEKDFYRMLEENNWLLLFKPHPFDEAFYRRHFKANPIKSKNVQVLYDAMLKKKGTNLYELFPSIDVLVSDFSSITLDYLVTNRPVIFLNALGEDYSQNRGFILPDNYEIMMPGEKVYTYTGLKQALSDALTTDPWQAKRRDMLPLIHKSPDNKACERVFEVMSKL